MSNLNTTNVLTAALQIAIVAHRSGQTVEEAKKNARTKLWETYTPDSQAAAERGIENYFRIQAGKVVSAPVVAGPVMATEPTLGDAIDALPTGYTKDMLLDIAKDFSIKVAKSWTKAKIAEVLIAASRIKKAA